jgi:hypothetical protein
MSRGGARGTRAASSLWCSSDVGVEAVAGYTNGDQGESLELKRIDFPRTHALARLAALLGAEAQGFDRSMLVELDVWAVAERYPEDLPEPSHDERAW